jgi:hypothetical protein
VRFYLPISKSLKDSLRGVENRKDCVDVRVCRGIVYEQQTKQATNKKIMIKKRTHLAGADRYSFDWDTCSTSKGWAQLDTQQDAPYFGTWANPFLLKTLTFAEGDVCVCHSENEQEFIEEVRAIQGFHDDQGFPFMGIDPGFNEALKEKFSSLGLGDLFHAAIQQKQTKLSAHQSEPS